MIIVYGHRVTFSPLLSPNHQLYKQVIWNRYFSDLDSKGHWSIKHNKTNPFSSISYTTAGMLRDKSSDLSPRQNGANMTLPSEACITKTILC